MTKAIPPLDGPGQAALERRADALLDAVGEEVCKGWPSLWPEQEETEFERIAAAHTGVVPLAWVSIVAALPSFDPESSCRDLQSLMQERPGADESEQYGELLSLLFEAEGTGARYGSGFTVERRNFPPEACRWHGCKEPLYAPGAPRGKGKPRKYCDGHKKAAETRRRARQRRGVLVGRNRNLVYDFDGLEEQDLTGYRELWGRINTIGS